MMTVEQLMRFAAALVLVLVVSGCGSAAATKPITSPGGTMTLTPSVNQSKTDRTKFLCVAFDIHDKSGKLLHRVQTDASDTHRWAIGWFDDQTVVLNSSDIGTYAWKLAKDDAISEMTTPLSSDLKNFGERIKAYD